MSNSFNEEKQEKRIEELHLKEAEDLAQVLASRYQLPYIDLSKTAINTDALRLISEAEAKIANVASFRLVGRTLHIAILSPNNSKVKELTDELKEKGYLVTLYLVSESGLNRAWGFYAEVSKSTEATAGLIDISAERVSKFLTNIKNINDIKQEIDKETVNTLASGGISGTLELLLSGALVTNASDIHLEPEETGIRLRYRLDGVLQDVTNFDERIYKQILSRIKLISGLKLNVKQSAQDGRFSIKAQEAEIEIRTSVIPGSYGESVVMRILDPKSIAVTFEQLGIEPELFKVFDREIHKPNGLVLLTGPTGSGKTTTLYAFLRQVNSSETKIITIEDPVEYHLKGVNQTQVNGKKGYTFLSGLRAALRQDPDIIMVGEIRDGETAKIAINSALTGHLVFSTLHTNNAAGAIPRLIDLGINPKIISSALTLSIAQRLVRKLCVKCRKEQTTTPEENKLITGVLQSIPKKKPGFDTTFSGTIYVPGGCEFCHNTGYKGRQGIFEAIVMDDVIANVATTNPSERDIIIASTPQGILDMRQDGIIKVVQGVTSLDELGRVVDLFEEIL
ncbi:MAG: type II/IV secretion system protein [Candidatus Vogelbacteria bacterium]|nr:type II/IV secretion system protein [Candidatus Vogelbacteria bacterium]